MRELVGDRGCIYTEGVYRGQQGPGQSGLWEWKNKKGGGRGFMVPKLQTPAKWPKAEAVVFISFFFFL